MHLDIDADMIAHETGHLRRKTGKKDEDGKDILGELFDVEEVWPIAKGRLLSIFIGSQCASWVGWLTKGEHYRHRQATIRPYKGHRDDLERDNVDLIKQLMADELDCKWCTGREADDAMATSAWQDIYQVGETLSWDDDMLKAGAGVVIATRDKDLDTVPGWKFKWWLKNAKDRGGNAVPEEYRLKYKGEAYWTPVRQAFRNFYKMALMGDSADNIGGLYGVGPKSALLSQIDNMDDEEEMYEHVLSKYVKWYGQFAWYFMKETCQLLHMQRYRGDRWVMPDERDGHYWDL